MPGNGSYRQVIIPQRSALLSSPSYPRSRLGNALALLAAVAFALADASASLAYHGGSNPLTLAGIRFVAPTIALIIWLRISHVSLFLTFWEGLIGVFLGILTAFYSWALLSSLSEVPVGLAILVFYLFPLLAAVILGLCGWEKFSLKGTAAITVAFVGLVLALGPDSKDLKMEGLALAFGAALGLAAVVVVSSRLFKATDPRPLTLYMAAVSALLLAALCAARGEFMLPQTGTGWFGFLSYAVFFGFGMISFFVAIPMIGPVRVSLLSYAEPVVAAGLGIILLGEALAAVQIAGIVLVIGALVSVTAQKPAEA